MNHRLLQFPLPPSFTHTNLHVSKYFPWDHPCTRWILNTFRRGVSTRLTSMLREKRQFFQCLFQIPDCPDIVTWDHCDLQPMFKTSTVLYLRPLSLAIYMHRRMIAQLLMESGNVSATEVSYATDTLFQSDTHTSADILSLIPAAVAVRRQYFEVLPIIFSNSYGTENPMLASDCFKLHYANKNIEKLIEYEDIFSYAIKVVKRNRILHISKLFDTLIFQCPKFLSRNFNHIFCQKHALTKHCLFHRILLMLLFENSDCRLTVHLIYSIQQLIRLNLYYRPEYGPNVSNIRNDCESINKEQIELSKLALTWHKLSFHIQDCLISVSCLFKIFEFLLSKGKASTILQIEEILCNALTCLGCQRYIETSSTENVQDLLSFLLSKEYERLQGNKLANHAILQSPNVNVLNVILSRLRDINKNNSVSRPGKTPGRHTRSDCEVSFACLESGENECFFCMNEILPVSYEPKSTEQSITVYQPIGENSEPLRHMDRNDHTYTPLSCQNRSMNSETFTLPNRSPSGVETRPNSASNLAEYQLDENKDLSSLLPKLKANQRLRRYKKCAKVANVSLLPPKHDSSANKVRTFLAERYMDSIPEKIIEVKSEEEQIPLRNSCISKVNELKLLTHDLESPYHLEFPPDFLVTQSLKKTQKLDSVQVGMQDIDQLIERIVAGNTSVCSDEIPMSDLDSIFIDDMFQECMARQEQWANEDELPMESSDKMTPLIRSSTFCSN